MNSLSGMALEEIQASILGNNEQQSDELLEQIDSTIEVQQLLKRNDS